MMIHVKETPNPHTLQFVVRHMIMGHQPGIDLTPDQSKRSPVAEKLFALSGTVQRVFLGHNFISVTKSYDESWDFLRPLVIHTVSEHFLSGGQVLSPIQEEAIPMNLDWNDPLIQDLNRLIHERIRPAVAQDGGDIQLKGFVQGVVYVQLMGACVGCPSSQMTLKMGVENMLKHYIPQVTEVKAI